MTMTSAVPIRIPIRIPYRLETERLVVRCYEPADAPALVDAMTAGVAHLVPWLPWASFEPLPVEEKIALLRTFRARFDLDQDYIYGAFERTGEGADGRLVGGTGIHLRIGPAAGEIGYWVRAGEERKGLATEMAAAMTCAGFAMHGFARMAIHCDVRNGRSAAVAERLGYRREGVLRAGADHGASPRGDLAVYGMTRPEFAASPAARFAVEALDAAGRPIAAGSRAEEER
jgi:RimJ/RimL family protein N-acetyltransferase